MGVKTYTGIGSRKAPMEILKLFMRVAEYLAIQGHTLRSGASPGSDKAFEIGCDASRGNKEIFLPWMGFEGSMSKYIVREGQAYELAKEYHPSWDNLSEGGKKLQSRNSHQIMGWDLKTPTDVVICWTPGGRGGGGTGQAIRIAKDIGVPIFDAGKYLDVATARVKLWEFLKENGFDTTSR